jgi:hypothetical protein
MFMDALKETTGGTYNLFLHKKIKGHPFDFFLFGLTANFEDSGKARRSDLWSTNWWRRSEIVRGVVQEHLSPKVMCVRYTLASKPAAPVKPDQPPSCSGASIGR